MRIASMKVGSRLALGFGLVLLMLAAITVIALAALAGIGEINGKIIDKDWVKADAANTVSVATRANARRSLELLVTTDKAQLDKIRERIDVNKKSCTAALDCQYFHFV